MARELQGIIPPLTTPFTEGGYPKAPILPVREGERVAMTAGFKDMGLL